MKATDVSRVPKFCRPVYLENKTKVADVDEIMGPIDGYLYSADLVEGVTPDKFKPGDKLYMNPFDLLPLDRFLPKPKGQGGPKVARPSGGAGGFKRGGGGFNRGGGGFSRGGF